MGKASSRRVALPALSQDHDSCAGMPREEKLALASERQVLRGSRP